MKNRIKFPAIVLGLLLLLTGFTQQTKAQDDDVSLQTFYDELSPYGTWIQDQEYGYVWRPDVDQSDFRPYYSNGRWAMTEYGNTWVSDYDWGWAPFHYGRWVTNRYNQWLWIPDTTWGPAWVSWRSGGGYYGWAPLGPRMGVSVNFGFSIPDLWWCFVPQANIYYSRFPRYYANRNYGILGRTTYITNVYVHNRNSYYTGPRRDDIRRATRQDVRVYNINRSDRPGRGGISNNSINMYTPRGGRGDNANAVPRTVAPGSSYIANRGGRGENGNGTRPDRAAERNPDGNRPDRGTANPGDRGTEGGRPGRFGTPGNRNQSGADRQQRDAQTPEQRQQRQQQFEQQRQQRGDAQRQQGDQQRQQRTEAENQQREQQRQQRGEAQRQQADQQRQQADQQQRQQRSEAENQQRQQQREQAQQQRQQAEQQQRQQRSEAENQQRQQQAQQQRQQVEQQRQQQQQQRSSESRGGGEGRGGRSGRN
ncbi:hypothetical protein LPB86_03060 [Pedobacter sp. MC2016-14]|nr:DUF6600 domain-containing protein [Pedobacter sp. MC2016-14]MCD0487190.1 hypothetical protein [Pedobacter sp. MC2016-14]